MADFLKSAASYFSGTASSYNSNGGDSSSGGNPLIGTVVNVNSVQYRIKRQIGEGTATNLPWTMSVSI